MEVSEHEEHHMWPQLVTEMCSYVSVATMRIDDTQRVFLIKLAVAEINISFDSIWRKA